MIRSRNILILVTLLTITTTLSFAQSGSYLDTVYQTEATNASSTTADSIRAEIQETYNIEIIDEPEVFGWDEQSLSSIKGVLSVLPESFYTTTKVISLIPSYMSVELKYNGFQGLEETVQIGQGALIPNPIYNRYFKSIYGDLPSSSEKEARFKTILVRAMAYCFINANPDIVSSWKAKFTTGEISTKMYGPGSDRNLVIGKYVTGAAVDMAFAISRYCAAGSNLKSKFPARYDFISANVMNEQEFSGWGDPTEISSDSTDTDNNDDDSDTNDSDTENDNDNEDEETNTDGTREPPEIPEGSYLPVMTEAGIGSETTTIPDEHLHISQEHQVAVTELFAELPKYFSTCTEAITYVPTTDTMCSFSSESYVFITQHSWYKPSYTTLDSNTRSKRFKLYLVGEMTRAFLFFHPEITTAWKTQFNQDKTTAAKADIARAVVEYYSSSSWLEELSSDRFNFIKDKIMQQKTF